MADLDNPIASFGAADILEQLQRNGVINEEQAEQVRRRVQRANVPAHQAVLDLQLASQEAVFRALADSQGLVFVSLAEQQVPDEVRDKIPAKVALHYKFVPLKLERRSLTAAFSTPPGMREKENLRMLLGLRLNPVIATPVEISRTLKNIYGLGAETVLQLRQERAQKRAEVEGYNDIKGEELGGGQPDDADASITRLVNQVLLEALEMGTTDVHIEPFEDTCRVRYRVDGICRTIPTPPGLRELHDAMASRLKIMANLNIAERRLPHDGRIRVRIGPEDFDLRVSILPTRFGETLCLRILNRSAIFLDMVQLGFNPKQLAILNHLVNMPHGIILVTGPTGSGKTTTLYAALAKVRDKNPGRKIITVEDPVEYVLEGISQVQIQSGIGLTFASGLRSILRHDPDIILVGEIRDRETAEIAIRSALTGHLVLSTLHTNDSVGAVNRLVDMGIEPFLVASSLVASIAQRLVRRLCPHCKRPDTAIHPRLRAEMAKTLDIAPTAITANQAVGCSECDGSGYRGRLAIFEVFLLDEVLQDMVSAQAATSELRHTAHDRGMQNLRDDGWVKVVAGHTSIDEVNRLTSSYQLSYDIEPEEARANDMK